MNIFVYSDESGVFDKIHNDYYIYGGLIFLDKETRDVASRKYIRAEQSIRSRYPDTYELKACKISNKDKSKLFRSLNQYIKFGVIIREKDVYPEIYNSKKDKQRYLDYAYKIGLKNCFQRLISEKLINKDEVNRLYVYVDEHTTATNGRYELKESLEQEFKRGTYNFNYTKFFPPIFTNIESVEIKYCNSEKTTLIRSADIVANRIFYEVTNGDVSNISEKICLKYLS